MKLGSIMIGSQHPDELATFYTKLLGKASWDDGYWHGFDCEGVYIMIGPHSEVEGTSKEPQRLIINFTCSDIHGEYDRIKALGVRVVAEPYQPDKDGNPDTWIATFADSDGNFCQFSSPWKT